MTDPVELARRLANGDTQRAGNRVQLEDEHAAAIGGANPLDVSVAGLPGLADPLPVTLETAAGNATGTAANPLRTDPTGTTAQPVSGPLTDAQLAARLPLSVGGPLTDAQLAARLPLQAYLATSAGVTLKTVDSKLRTSSMPYLYDIAEGNVTGHVPWSKIGYVPIPATTETDVWSYGGTAAAIPLIAAAATLKVQTNNAADAGTSIFSGVSSGGSTTSLVDITKDFTGGTPVAAGDCVLLDPAGTTPEWGFVTAIPNATTLTVAGGFSSGGTGSGRTYSVIDYSNQAGAHVVRISGLDANWARQTELVVCAGAGPGYTTTAKTWQRVNTFRMVAAGANSKPSAAIALMDSGAVPATTYSYISAGYTRARNSHYTVPSGKTLFIVEWNVGYVGSSAAKYCRIWTRASQFSSESGETAFLTRVSNGVNVWYPYTEIVQSGGSISVQFPTPTRILQKTDIKISAYADANGVVTSTLRGWLEDA